MRLFLLKVDIEKLLLGDESWSFLPEALFRTFFMFIVILLSLRLLGKRGIKQLSVFELGVIIGLGSAAGDPMFYKDVGLLSGVLVLLVVVCLYKLITFIVNRSEKFEKFVEGEETEILDSGCFLLENFNKEPIARDEFFAQLRLNNVTHLGQVKLAILETNGETSIFFYPDDEVKYGLPIIPRLCKNVQSKIEKAGYYACADCAHTLLLHPAPEQNCPVCTRKKWVLAINEKRIA